MRTTISAGPRDTYEVMLEESSVTVDIIHRCYYYYCCVERVEKNRWDVRWN